MEMFSWNGEARTGVAKRDPSLTFLGGESTGGLLRADLRGVAAGIGAAMTMRATRLNEQRVAIITSTNNVGKRLYIDTVT